MKMNKLDLSQAKIIHDFNEATRPKFNPKLFERSDDKLIEEIRKVIYSIERNQAFIIKVLQFNVYKNYKEIMDKMYEYEESVNHKDKNRNKNNIYDYVNLKDSDVILLEVVYYVAASGNIDTFKVYILIPRIVDKYYYKILGNYYSPMYQIVDGSTYNNGTSSNIKKPKVTQKIMVNIFKNEVSLEDIHNNTYSLTYYSTNTFDRTCSVMKYMLARLGLVQTLDFLELNYIYITDVPEYGDDFVTIEEKGIYIAVPKYIFENEEMVQSLVYTLKSSIEHYKKDVDVNKIFSRDFWLESLGAEFGFETVEKGISLLESLETLYDITSREKLRLPDIDKETIYHVLRWMMREFKALLLKDNLDISTKRVRIEEYLALLYSTKLVKGILRIAKTGRRITVDTIKKAIKTQPYFLLKEINKCNIVNYRDMSNDLDSITALEFTYKGLSGIGEKNTRSVPDIYRAVHPSHLKRIDLDSSPKSSPGLAGILCPFTEITEDGYFSDFQEPNDWRLRYADVVNNYKSMTAMKETIEFKEKVLGIADEELKKTLYECLDITKDLIEVIEFVDSEESSMSGV